MPQTDFIPQNPTAFVVWFSKFILHLKELSAKYELSPEKIEALSKDHEWVRRWAWVRINAGEQEKRQMSYFNAMVNGKNGSTADPVSPPTGSSEASAEMPDDAVRGIKERVREIAERVKSKTDVYTKEDGALLGILTPEEAGWSEDDYTPEMKFTQLSDYSLEVSFRKYRLDAIRVEYRRVQGDWQAGGFLTKSPDVLKIPPRDFGSPEQIEIRAVFWFEDRSYGSWSPIYRLKIVP